MYSVILYDDAMIDRAEVVDWYENICPNLGIDFYEELLTKLENTLTKFPKIAPTIYKNARKMSLNRFPYNLIYVVDDEKKEVQVLAIVHDKRNPSVWQNRVT